MDQLGRHSVVGRFVVVALALPVILTAFAVGVIFAWHGDLPDPVAIHWGGNGGPDGFGSLASAYVAAILLGLGVPALYSAVTLPMLKRGARGPSFRFMGSMAAGVSVFSAVLNTWSIAMQRGLADAHGGPSLMPALGAGFGAGIAAGVAAWFFQPRQRTVVEGLRHDTRLDLGEGERAVWMRTATAGRPVTILMAAVVIGLGVASFAFWQAGQEGAAWIYGAASAVLVLAFAATATFHVVVDDKGLSAVSALGVPRFGVRLDDVVDAGVAHVNGFAEFGGWGVRQRPGALGIVLRNGESLQVTRRNGRRLVITVDDAATAAALLTALASRARTTPSVSP